ncbi:aminotransferase class IV [Clostridium frigidicarnis]|uniref:4-amino-4-deoxychorismate lyase n=1 Tax=Clostridium frigidicarnis TaxID=84698 RepID=A0A1I0WUK5_9CLOT|nr:aminotransferase class IV [Clostridium frigidicarnis]SFA92087.1 4-amino-4-deoxychorismate lyase [Clostridium frigidicarnis]
MILINESNTGELVLDDGLNFGLGAFETIKISNGGKAILLEEHIERLKNTLNALNIKKEISVDKIYKYITSNNLKNIAFKILVTSENIVFSTRSIPYTSDYYKRGFNVYFSEYRRNSKSLLTYHKTLNYGENILEKRNAFTLGFDEPLFLNERYEITEGATTNIFFIKNNEIYTPKICSGLLNGILRQWVIDNFKVHEGLYTLEDLKSSHEIFLTNSLMGIMKVNKIEGYDLNLKYEKTYEILKTYLDFEER